MPARVPGSAGLEQRKRALAGWLKLKPCAVRAKQAQPSSADAGTVRLTCAKRHLGKSLTFAQLFVKKKLEEKRHLGKSLSFSVFDLIFIGLQEIASLSFGPFWPKQKGLGQPGHEGITSLRLSQNPFNLFINPLQLPLTKNHQPLFLLFTLIPVFSLISHAFIATDE
ncbi:hypothetical protein [Pedobacter sp. SYSU D00535]|uniref:hypothetical protein n=1 Tax=Pedobacter sp. SYSU D00535 TaxID=2810308 RepID=UPI001A96300F|nr:hypothetical protein [Pedobacter sp. SYSU D00535]